MIMLSYYDVIRCPVFTEKASMFNEIGKYVFRVSVSASKADIKRAIDALFGVECIKINTLNKKGKSKRFRGILGKRRDTKIAIATLKHGQVIDLVSGNLN